MKYISLIITFVTIAVTLPAAGQSFAEFDEKHLATLAERDSTDRAIDAGLRYLLSRQNATHGYFEGRLPNTYTALACMALMAAGHFPDRSEFGDALRRGILYLADATKEHDGYLGREGNARMYGHTISTLALLEAYGMLADEEENIRVRDAARKAIQVVIDAQVTDRGRGEHFGGWRYQPDSRDADLSVTVWQLLALRAADNCGMEVPHEAITNAVNYVRGVYSEDRGGFTYQRNHSNHRPAMRSAGIVSLASMGEEEASRDREKMLRAAEFMRDFDPDSMRQHFFYAAYYVATAANMLGEEHRELVLPPLEEFLVSLQKDDGSFQNHHGYDGDVYSTAFSVITLAIRYQYLPIYQE